jgi:hypothetical protein
VADSVVGAALCALLAAAVKLHASSERAEASGAARAHAWSVRLAALLLAAAVAVAVLAGGTLVAAAVIAGVLASLLRLPPLRSAVPPLLAVLLGLAAARWAAPPRAAAGLAEAGGPPAVRAAEAAPAYAVLALLDQPATTGADEPLQPERRAQRASGLALAAAREAGPWHVALALARRLLDELLAPARFGERGSGRWWLGLADVLLRAALVALVLVGLAGAGRRGARSWASVGPLAGAAVLLAGLVAGATHPFALAPLDAVLAGAGAAVIVAWRARVAAGAGPAPMRSADERTARSEPRRALAGAAALAVLPALLATVVALRDRPLSPWLLTLHQDGQEGSELVRVLADGGPRDGQGELVAALTFTSRGTPFLRWPDAAHRHAVRALQAAPLDELALRALIEAEVELLAFDRALDLANSLRDDSGLPTATGRVLAYWVRDEERLWRAERFR